MQRPELEQRIRDYIKIVYKSEYVGFLRVIQNGISYVLEIGIPSYMSKTFIGYETEYDEQFLLYVFEELRTRNYMRTFFYGVTRGTVKKDE